MTKTYYRNRDWLREKYWDENATVVEMGDICDVSGNTILYWMDKFEIPRRSVLDATARNWPWELHCLDWLEERYVEEGLSTRQIADIIGCSAGAVQRQLAKHSIALRTPSETRTNWDQPYTDVDWLRAKYWGEELSTGQIATEIDVHPSVIIAWLKRHGIRARTLEEAAVVRMKHQVGQHPYSTYEWLHEKYIEKQLTMNEMADMVDCTQKAIAFWLRYFNIPIRSSSESWALRYSRMSFEAKYTTTEIPLAEALDQLDIEHISQYSPPDCRFWYDEFIPPGTLIETHGTYWHGHPDFYPEPNDDQQAKIAKDREKKVWAIENGYELVVIWEHEIEEFGARQLVQNRVMPLMEVA